MTVQYKYLFATVCALILGTQDLNAAYTLQNGRFVDVCEAATMSVQGHYSAGAKAIEDKDWKEAAMHFSIITINFPKTVYAQDAYYYLGASYYFLKEYDFANTAFTEYLKSQSNPRYFEETIFYKFSIAEYLSCGAKRRFFGTKQLPKWACGKSLALDIYDEVIAAVPCHEIAAKALIAKGRLHWLSQDYRPAVEAFQQVIRRFPKEELAPECYVYISKLYLEQSLFEFQNPDILAFAQINLRRFSHDFPREERICEVTEDVNAIKEVYASGLYEMGLFYERIRKPRASIIYYHNAIHQFPETCIAEQCRERLSYLDPTYVANCLKDVIETEETNEDIDYIEDQIIELDVDES